MTTVINADGSFAGVFTDGDLRRTLDQGFDVHSTAMTEVMTSNGKRIGPDMLAAEAMRVLEQNKITSLVVMSDDGGLAGVLHIHDLLRAGVA
jgi:arabinose-5-phosphate isomerase